MKLDSAAEFVQVISGETPLGRALVGKSEGDELWIDVAQTK